MPQLMELPHSPTADLATPGLPDSVTALLQPIYAIGRGERKIVAAEALARGPLGSATETPAAMFDAARKLGLVTRLDRDCIVAGLRAARRLPQDVSIFLNVHPGTLCRDCGFPAALAEAASENGIALSRITLEVLEYARVAERQCRQLHAALDVLRDNGVRVAVDDVGCGTEEIRRAFTFRPDCVKLDGDLVRAARTDLSRRALIDAVVEMAEATYTLVIAEGVSAAEDLAFVAEKGIALVQGFLLCRPVSAGELCSIAGWPLVPPAYS